jgi:hypothetical protein
LKAFANDAGAIYILYRAATDVVNRDEILLMSDDGGKSFRKLHADPWKVATCPMSSAAFSQKADGVLAAWETDGQVRYASITGGKVSPVVSPSGIGKRKHPVTVSNNRGETLLVWAEGTGWQRGGSLAWQLFDAGGKPIGERGRQDGVPVWSFGNAYTKDDGSFVVIY